MAHTVPLTLQEKNINCKNLKNVLNKKIQGPNRASNAETKLCTMFRRIQVT